MASTPEFVIERAQATLGAQVSFAGAWTWEEKTVAQWEADIAAIVALREIVEDADAGQRGKAGELDNALEILRGNTLKILTLTKTRYRNEPPKLHLVKGFTLKANSRSAILEEALEVESAWEKLDAAWAPLPGMTLANFKSSRVACIAMQEDYARLKAEWRKQAEQFNEAIAVLDDACMAWYKAATAVFPSGTPEGDMIRGTIPTTYSPLDLPAKAVITSITSPADGEALLQFASEHASSYRVLVKLPGASDYILLADDVEDTEYHATGFNSAGGIHAFKVIGKNSRGDGPESDPAEVQIDKP